MASNNRSYKTEGIKVIIGIEWFNGTEEAEYMRMVCLHVPCWMVAMFLFILAMLNCMVMGENTIGDPNDIHGGVAMGVTNPVCDDGQTYIQLDWDPSSSDEFTCTEGRHENYQAGLNNISCEEFAQRPLHMCYPRNITYTDDLPTSGSHRPLWPQYGTYRYLPPQRWIHSLEHGAVVFLYHPCADPREVAKFKAVARDCMYRHIISPYKKMPQDMAFALLSWRCKLVMSSVDVPLMVNYIKARALRGPERVSGDGQYEVGLLRHAEVVSDIDDSRLCPGMLTMSATAKNFKHDSAARRHKSQQSQEETMQILNRLMAQITSGRE